MQASAEFWDKTAAKYAKSPIEDMAAYTYTLDRTRSYLTPTDRVLELGCGTGSTALLLARDVAHITASDSSPEMINIGIEKARQEGVSNIDLIVADVMDTSLDPASDGTSDGPAYGPADGAPYDAVLAHNLIHLLSDPEVAIAKCHSLLKPGGIFISKTACKFGAGSPLKFRLIKAVLPVMQFFNKAPFVNFMEIAALETMIQDAGFEIIETGNHPTTSMSRYVVARKV